MNLPLKERLLKAASLVGFDSVYSTSSENKIGRCEERIVVSDVGCDHAYLSLHLVLSGICTRAIASDVRKGPLEAAKENIARYGCEDRIDTLLTDGLRGIEPYNPTDIVICGMGGETIIDILNDAPFVKEKGRRLILQPMTGVAELALFLSLSGFRIYKERYALDGSKPYRIFGAVYDGIEREISLVDAMAGSLCFEEDREAYNAFCGKTANAIDKKAKGVRARGVDTSELEALFQAVIKKINNAESESILWQQQENCTRI